jgi:tRNA (guanine-N7-)-methyltransferase
MGIAKFGMTVAISSMLLAVRPTDAFRSLLQVSRTNPRRLAGSSLFSTTSGGISGTDGSSEDNGEGSTTFLPPWSFDVLTKKRRTQSNVVRVRQHVNPLARRFQLPTLLSEQWPANVFHDMTKSLFLDIGVGKGGFLLDISAQKPTDYNYLGLEIRPLAVQFAQERLNSQYHQICQGHVDFVGCNANVDLRRLLTLYRDANTSNDNTPLQMVTIQFPDPHFKSSHAKRRVVTPELVATLAPFMPPGAKVFLQSDVQPVLDDMRERFREASCYFQDQVESVQEYWPDNILGVPTERETSVLKQDLPVYRALFTRTDTLYEGEEQGRAN